MRFGKAARLVVAGLAVAAGVFAVRFLAEPRDASVGVEQAAVPIEQAQDNGPSDRPAGVEEQPIAADPASSVPPAPEPAVETARPDAAPDASPLPSADQIPPLGSLRDVRPLITGEVPPRSAEAAAGHSSGNGGPVAIETDTSLGGVGPGLVGRRSLTVTAAAPPASERPAAEAFQARSDTAAVVLQDARALAPPSTPSGPAADTSLGPDRSAWNVPAASPNVFRDGRTLSPAALQEPQVLQDARALVPAQPNAAVAPVPQVPQISDRPSRAVTAARAPLPAGLPATGAGCAAPVIATTALDSGRMRLLLKSECRAHQDVQLAYGGATLIRRLDAAGQLDFTLDAFAGTTSALDVTLADGRRESVPVVANDLDRLAKVAVIWRAPVNLDLHAFEYASPFGQAGHVWERKPVTPVAAQEIMRAGRRGRGFLSSHDDGRSVGDKLEVYTFFHHDEQVTGVVELSVDYETRGELPSGATCGSGAYAEVTYQFSIRNRQGPLTRESGVLAAAPCGVRVAPEIRFDPLLLPALRVRKYPERRRSNREWLQPWLSRLSLSAAGWRWSPCSFAGSRRMLSRKR